MKNYYQILYVRPTATDSDIKRSYRVLAKKFHPDVNPGDKTAESRFAEINEAYEVLSDPDKRAEYDSKIAASSEQEGGAYSAGPREDTRQQQQQQQSSQDDVLVDEKTAAAEAAAVQAAAVQAAMAQAAAAKTAAAVRNSIRTANRRSPDASTIVAHRMAAAQAAAAQRSMRQQLAAIRTQSYKTGYDRGKNDAQRVSSRATAKLTGDVKRLSDKLAELKSDRTELERELFNRDRELSQEKGRTQDLERQLANAMKSAERAKEGVRQSILPKMPHNNDLELERLRAKLKTADEQIRSLEAEKREAELKLRVREVSFQTKSDEGEVLLLKDKLKSANDRISKLEAEKRDLLDKPKDGKKPAENGAELDAMREKLKVAVGRIQKLENDKKKAEEREKALKDSLAAAGTPADTDSEELREKLREANDRILALEKEKAELEKLAENPAEPAVVEKIVTVASNEIPEEVMEKLREAEELREKLREAEALKEQLKENEALKEQLRETEELKEKLREAEELEERLRNADEQIQRMELEKQKAEESAQLQAEQHQDRRQALLDEINSLRAKEDELSGALKEVQAENEQLQQNAAEDPLDELRRQVRAWEKKKTEDRRFADGTLYGALGVLVWATAEEINKAYIKLERRYSVRTDEFSVNKFAAVKTAYETLSDPDKRSDYNKTIGIDDVRIETERMKIVEYTAIEEEYRKKVKSAEFWKQFDELTAKARDGDAESQNRLGELYYDGVDVGQDFNQAVYWFMEAFKRKNANAMYNLGICFINGEGVEANQSRGLAFIHQAAKLGSENAKNFNEAALSTGGKTAKTNRNAKR